MSLMTIFVDADSCPRKARDLIVRAALRTETRAVFAANRVIPGLEELKNGRIVMEVCPPGQNQADDRIVGGAEPGDLVVTRDVPLAARLVVKNVTVIDDRGRLFTAGNIRYHLSLRDFNIGLAENNLGQERRPHYGQKEIKAFAAEFDKQLRLLR